MPGGRRHPVDRALRQMAAIRRQVGHDRPLSLDEAVHVSEGVSRRDFLKLGGIAARGLVLAVATSPPVTSHRRGQVVARRDAPSVAIMGAGSPG